MTAEEGITLWSHKNYKAGDEVFDSYSKFQCNTQWLTNYGFLMPGGDCYCDNSESSREHPVQRDKNGKIYHGYCDVTGNMQRPANPAHGTPISPAHTYMLRGVHSKPKRL